MNHLVSKAGLEGKIDCDSAGTSSYHLGSSPDRRMMASLRARGFPAAGCARQFERADFKDFDLILAMDNDNYRNILALDSSGQYHDRVKLICDYAQQYSDKEVPDPYFGGQAGFEYVISLLEDTCGQLLAEITPILTDID